MIENWFDLYVGGTPAGVFFEIGLDESFQKKILESEVSMDSIIFSAICAFLIEFCNSKDLDFNSEIQRVFREYYTIDSDTSVLKALVNNINLKGTLDSIEKLKDSNTN